MGRKEPSRRSVGLRYRGLRGFSDSFSSSTLAIRLRSRGHRLVVPDMPVRLLPCRSAQATRSRRGSTTPGCPTQTASGCSVGSGAGPSAAPFASVGGGGLPREGQEMGRGSDGLECGGGAQASQSGVQTCGRRGGRGLGQGVGQGGQKGGLAEAHATTRLQSIAEEVGRGADLLLAGTKSPYEQRLRAAAGELSEAFIYAAMTRLMVRRLARA